MAEDARFGTGQLFLTDSRLILAVANHLRHQALNRAFGLTRQQSNVLTAVLLLGAADVSYEAARKVTGLRLPHVSGEDAGIGALALREAALGVAGPSNRMIPGFGTLVAVAVLGGVALPAARRAAHRMRVAEQHLRAAEARVRHERIRRYAAARDRMQAARRSGSD